MPAKDEGKRVKPLMAARMNETKPKKSATRKFVSYLVVDEAFTMTIISSSLGCYYKERSSSIFHTSISTKIVIVVRIPMSNTLVQPVGVSPS